MLKRYSDFIIESIKIHQVSPIKGELPSAEYLTDILLELQDADLYVNFAYPVFNNNGEESNVNVLNKALLDANIGQEFIQNVMSKEYYVCKTIIISVTDDSSINSEKFSNILSKVYKKLDFDGWRWFVAEQASMMKNMIKEIVIYPKDKINEALIHGKLPNDYDLEYVYSVFEEFEVSVRIIHEPYHDSESRLIHQSDKKYIDNNDVYICKDIFIEGNDITDINLKKEFDKLVKKIEVDGYRTNIFEGTFGSGALNYLRLVIYPKNI